ncbi:hypothetical protein [Chitinophaga sp.]|uniref:baeRF7 domain-containing protein n=1 Tax=Chitinophaga sp. TaxID=1869181 RepID=UPI0031D0CC30
MGKDREGRFIPPKGKPSGSGRESKLGLRPGMAPEDLEKDQSITDKYTSGEDEPAPKVRMRHPNRNVHKGDEEEIAANNKTQNSYKNRYNSAPDGAAPRPEPLEEDMSKDDLAALAGYTADCCITLVMPTHRAGMEVNEQQDGIAFKTILQSVQQQLLQQGMRTDEVEPLLMHAFALANDETFWRRQLNGLAVFIAPDVFKYMKLPYAAEQQQYIQQTFDVSPLLPLFTAHEAFFVLVLNKRKAELFEANIFGMKKIRVKEFAMGIDDMVRSEGALQDNMDNTEGTAFHGEGTGKPTDRSNISMYMDEADQLMWNEALSTRQAPLLLAGVESLLPVYHHRSRYQHIADTYLPGNFEEENIQSLCTEARKKLQPYLEVRLQKALDRYNNSIATRLTSSMPETVIPACFYARAEVLFVQKGYHLWGHFNAMDNQLALRDVAEEGDVCMVNAAAVNAYLNGAEVFLLDKERMPNGAAIAALMRYEA